VSTKAKILRYIDAEGREQDVDDVNHLYELIQENRVSFDSLVWDDEERRWVAARSHEFFRRIREIAAASPPQLQPWSAPLPRQPTSSVPPAPQVYKSPLMQHRDPAPEAAASAPKEPKSNWLKAIKTREEALKTIKDSSSAFFRRRAASRYRGMAGDAISEFGIRCRRDDDRCCDLRGLLQLGCGGGGAARPL